MTSTVARRSTSATCDLLTDMPRSSNRRLNTSASARQPKSGDHARKRINSCRTHGGLARHRRFVAGIKVRGMDATPLLANGRPNSHRRNRFQRAISVAIKPFIDAAFPVCIRVASLFKPRVYGPSANGAINLAAGHDVNLSTAQTTQSQQQSSEVKHSGIVIGGGLDLEYQGKQTTNTSSSSESTVVGSTLSGDTVTIAAGHDLTAQAAQIAATHDVTLAAGNN